MKKKLVGLVVLSARANFWPMIALLSVLLFYYFVRDHAAWYLYVFAGLIVVERSFLQLRILIGRYITDQAVKILRENVGKAAKEQRSPLMLPPTPEETNDS